MFIHIRFLQIYRSLKDAGMIRVFVLFALLGLAGYILSLQLQAVPNVYYVSGLYILVIGWFHFVRRDKLFLKTQIDNFRKIYITEYLLLSVPLLVGLLAYEHWLLALVTVPFSILLSYVDYKPKVIKHLSTFQNLVPNKSFEWKAGIRRYGWYIVIIWIAAIVFSFSIGSVPVAIAVIGILTLGFYDNNEPVTMLIVYEKTPVHFILYKIKIQWLLFSALVVPLLLLFIILHLKYWYIAIIEYIVFVSLHIYLILLKYAFYEPNKKHGGAQVFGSLGIISAIVFPLVPLLWILGLRFYIKSKNNLSFYLDDYYQ
jgi:hypothetical protein